MERYKYYIRHIIPFILFIFIITTLLIVSNNVKKLEYEYIESTDSYIVKKAYGNAKNYTIPEKYNDKLVTGIGIRAFFKNDNLEEIIFENKDNIKLIDRLAFYECINLKTIDLSKVDVIGENAFSYNKSLNDITLSLNYILGSTFYRCESLSNLKLEEGVKSIGTFAFSHTALKEIKLPKTITTVYVDAFKYNELEKIYVPLTLFSVYLNNSLKDILVYY